jgi:heme exporter protein CcmD
MGEMAMGGYGFYIWSAYGATGVILLGLLLATWMRRRKLKRAERELA